MHIPRMPLEDWFDRYQFEVDYDLGESAVHTRTVQDLSLGVDLSHVPLRYGHHQGLPELREAIAAGYPGLTADDVVVTSGASEAISILARVMLSRGDHCVVEHPTYPTLYEVPRAIGAEVDLFRLRAEDGWRPDWDRLKAQTSARTRLISLTHPNNPTGSVVDEAELRDVSAWATGLGVPLLVDETYRDLSYGTPPPPAASLSEQAISISTMSKCYGLPGLRIGWIATRDRDLIRQVVAAREYLTITNNTLGEVLALHVLQDRERHLAPARAQVAANLRSVTDWVRTQPLLDWVSPAGGVVALAELSGVDASTAQRLYRTLAERHRTFVVPGDGFELPANYFRLGFGSRPADLAVGLQRLSAALAELRSA
ncbi:aminotransferase class I/II-fold pyridoxal phosphate-dependent enzyme [Streptomyces sp. NPDC059134]|uniref:aminotransferase class I/II-fold pyridoxal phosphate-dependent enzyme n=1 Tax=Streptomyces sp. NPDC059134 TaxID=3346738 RepID=UPI0036B620AD